MPKGGIMKINILGTDYNYVIVKHDDDSRLRGNDGFADFYEKTIGVASDYHEDEPHATRGLDMYRAKVKRHEIAHAFLFESGMEEWAHDEALIDWIAIQFPKLLKAFQEVGAV